MVNKVKFRKLLENYEIICCCNNFHYLSMFKIVRWEKDNEKHLITITKYILCHIYHCFQKFLVTEIGHLQSRVLIFSQVEESHPKCGL